jgi:hypothetical protein
MIVNGSDAALVLDAELLGELERRWRDQGWPGVDWLQPGLDDGEIDAMTSPLGLRLPLEARRWWGWRDGLVLPEDAAREQHVFGGPGFVYLSLSGAVHQYKMMRDTAKSLVDSGPDVIAEDEFWQASEGRWDRDYEAIAPEREVTRLV